ncbi:MAG TPA: Gfo/Idh/MocA family oxidoreductase, partial [Thermodesulfobacteriota bacterium]|nr:Gfo/Idh/MocA family oxidoreductase [Thermodesulfobacteriota bacterium]
AMARTHGHGADGVIIAASAKGDDIVHQAAQACRKRGRIILVGVSEFNLRRSDFYEKELTFQVSCSYGPGRYDEKYEKGGQDYPYGFVRWTEQRNFEAVLEAMRSGQLKTGKLITHRIAFEEADRKYDAFLHDPGALGIVIEYPADRQHRGNAPPGNGNGSGFREAPHLPLDTETGTKSSRPSTAGGAAFGVGVIGAGNFARSTLLPALKRTGASILSVADLNPVASAHAAAKFGAKSAVTDYRRVLDDPGITGVFILVGHHLHSRFVCEALRAGKHVFVEKPLCIHESELNEICSVYSSILDPHSPAPVLMVGFNRRFSPHISKIRDVLRGRTEPLCMNMTVNAGFIARDHWTQDPEVGGGRIIGEGCHFIDLLCCLAGARAARVSAFTAEGQDRMSIALQLSDGSIGTVNYFANGTKSYPKEILEVFSEGRVIRMENFRVTKGYGFRGFQSFRTWRQDKGHRAEIDGFIESASGGGEPPIPFQEIVNVTRASFAAVEAARKKTVITLPMEFASIPASAPQSIFT